MVGPKGRCEAAPGWRRGLLGLQNNLPEIPSEKSFGKEKEECGTLTDLAVDPDLSAVSLDDVFDNGETETGATKLPGTILVHPVEAFENSVDVFHRDTDSGGGYRYFD